MFFRFRLMYHLFRVLPRIYTGASRRISGTGTNLLADTCPTASSFNPYNSIHGRLVLLSCQGQRYSTLSETKRELLPMIDSLSFIQSSLREPKGPFHRWLNKAADVKKLFKEDGLFLVLIGEYIEDSLEANQVTVKMIEKAKFLQQRYPSLQVLALQYSKSICMNDISSHLLPRIIKDYVTFPILLSNNDILEMANMPCYVISRGFRDPMVYPGEDVDLKVLDKAIHDSNEQNGKGAQVLDTGSTWFKPIEVKEPEVCSASRNLLFSLPGCISVDETGNLFLSDINHHRIIVFDRDGKILDAIGGSPGFEDGEFENAKLMRPAASFYHASEDCLYFVDSENHAIRRADMERRVVETVFPVTDGSKKNKGLWQWILEKIWTKSNAELKSEEFDSGLFMFPWHLLKSSNSELFVLNQSFGTLWILDLELGLIREVVKESSKILEICGQMILEKCIPLREIHAVLLEQEANASSFEGIPYAGLMSSVTTCQDCVVFCDRVGQMVVKFSTGSASAASFQFSNFGTFGLPYWLSSSLEQVYADDDVLSGADLDHSQCFRLLPGRVDIELDVDIPQHAVLVELPQEGSIWRQARGAAAEVSGVGNKAASPEKVGVAQQWYDELDHLSFSTPGEEPSTKEENGPSLQEVQGGRIRIVCAINTSPGTSEVIIYAALYLRLKKNTVSHIDSQENKAARIADILEPKKKSKKDLLVKLLTMSSRDLDDLIFMRPLHVRLKFNTRNHPKADNNRDIILTDSSVNVHVKL